MILYIEHIKNNQHGTLVKQERVRDQGITFEPEREYCLTTYRSSTYPIVFWPVVVV